MPNTFEIGARVRLRSDIGTLAAGALGTVTESLGADGLIGITFDTSPEGADLLEPHEVERVETR